MAGHKLFKAQPGNQKNITSSESPDDVAFNCTVVNSCKMQGAGEKDEFCDGCQFKLF